MRLKKCEFRTKSTDDCESRRVGVMDTGRDGVFLWVGGDLGEGDNEDDDQVAILNPKEAARVASALVKWLAARDPGDKKP